MHVGFGELAIILIVGMLLFGPKRVSELGVALGQSIRGFKKGLSGEEEIKHAGAATTAQAQPNGRSSAPSPQDTQRGASPPAA